MPASPIRKLVPFAEQAKKKGIKVYHLNIGQPDIEMPKEAIDALHNIDINILEYSHSAGNDSYRKKLAEYYKVYGINLDPAYNILITTGGSEAITIALMSCMDPGDEIIVPEPLYANYNGFSVASDVIVKPITSTIETGFALPGIEAFEKLITPRTKAILICNPNNPTGYLYSRKELEALRDLVLKHDLFLFADEVYRDFIYDGKEHVSLLNIPGLEKNAVVIDSVSKRFSMCGARIGTLISYNKELMLIALKFAQARLSPPSLGQIAAEAALDADDEYFNEVNDEYLSRRNLMVKMLNQIPGVYCPTPGGAFYTIARLPIDDCDKFCQWLLESFSYENETVMLAPATGFYSTKGLGKNEVRLAYVLNKNDLSRAIRCLDEALKVYPGRIV
jgi:aspartate aminotransferase